MAKYNTMANSLAAEMPQYICGDHTPQFQALTYALLKRYRQDGFLADIPAEDISVLARLASYHDIGKAGLPDSVLHKNGALTEPEFELMKEHTRLGAKMVMAATPELWDEKEAQHAREICLHHHERWDGSGYPDGLRGHEIPEYVQIISLADVYDALIAPRSYRRPCSHDIAVRTVISGACGSFAPALLLKFRMYIDEIHERVYPN